MINTIDAIIIYVEFFLYFVGMFLIGCYALTKTSNNDQFVLGGRTLGPWVSGISSGASDMSSWLILGLPGAAYAGGLVDVFWLGLGVVVFAYLNWLIVAEKLRRYSERLNAITVPNYLQNRFNADGSAIKILSAIVILFFFTLYVSSGLKGGALLFSYVFDSSDFLGLVFTTIIVVSYTFLGGYIAVCWTDLVQGLLILASLAFLTFLGYFALFSANIDITEVRPGALSIETSWLSALSAIVFGLGYFGQPHILSRFMGIRSASEIASARRIAMTWTVLVLVLAICIGLIGIGYGELHSLAGVEGLGGDKERIFLVLTYALFHPVVAGLVLSAVLAALMSTADSQLLVLSSAISEDLPFFNKIEGEKKLWISRLGVVVFASTAMVIATFANESILSMVAYAWGGFGAAFGPLIILSVCWKGTTQWGAIAGIISGTISIIVFKNFIVIADLYELLPSFFLSLFVIVIISLITPKPSAETIEALR
ncbi:MAG: sodium/proline symporter [Arenicella sp.]